MRALAFACLALALVALACGGDDDSPETPTANAPQPAATVRQDHSGPRMPPPPAPGAQRSFIAGRWAISYGGAHHECDKAPQVLDIATATWEFREETEDDGLISDGEIATVHNGDGGFVGRYQFAWPTLEFHVNLADVGTVRSAFTFAQDGAVTGARVETWGDSPNDTCDVTMTIYGAYLLSD